MKKLRLLTSMLVASVALVLTGCGDDDDGGDSAQPIPAPASLTGKTYNGTVGTNAFTVTFGTANTYTLNRQPGGTETGTYTSSKNGNVWSVIADPSGDAVPYNITLTFSGSNTGNIQLGSQAGTFTEPSSSGSTSGTTSGTTGTTSGTTGTTGSTFAPASLSGKSYQTIESGGTFVTTFTSGTTYQATENGTLNESGTYSGSRNGNTWTVTLTPTTPSGEAPYGFVATFTSATGGTVLIDGNTVAFTEVTAGSTGGTTSGTTGTTSGTTGTDSGTTGTTSGTTGTTSGTTGTTSGTTGTTSGTTGTTSGTTGTTSGTTGTTSGTTGTTSGTTGTDSGTTGTTSGTTGTDSGTTGTTSGTTGTTSGTTGSTTGTAPSSLNGRSINFVNGTGSAFPGYAYQMTFTASGFNGGEAGSGTYNYSPSGSTATLRMDYTSPVAGDYDDLVLNFANGTFTGSSSASGTVYPAATGTFTVVQ